MSNNKEDSERSGCQKQIDTIKTQLDSWVAEEYGELCKIKKPLMSKIEN